MNIGEVLVSLREQKGIDQPTLANALKKSVTYISLIENNRRKPSVSLLSAIADYYDIPVTAIIFSAMDTGELKSAQSKAYFKAAKPIVDKLIQYLLSDDETAKEQGSVVSRKKKVTLKKAVNEG